MPNPPSNRAQRWTADELAKLGRLVADGLPTPAIAKALGRTQEAITRKASAEKLPISFRGRTPNHQSLPPPEE